VLAASEVKSTNTAPTKYAQLDVQPTATSEPTDAPTEAPQPTVVPTEAPTAVATKRPSTAAPKNTSVPAPTSQPQAAAAAPPEFHPDFPTLWWQGVNFVAASATPNQQYWHLKWALYCDAGDKRNNCPSMAGGGMDHTIYVSVLNPDGSCANIAPSHQINTGDTPAVDKKAVAYAWNPYPCNIDYEWAMSGEGNDFWIAGAPSDRINGLCMCNVIPPPGSTGILQGHAHVRYFLIFQQTVQ
jgi:hypothetical protein